MRVDYLRYGWFFRRNCVRNIQLPKERREHKAKRLRDSDPSGGSRPRDWCAHANRCLPHVPEYSAPKRPARERSKRLTAQARSCGRSQETSAALNRYFNTTFLLPISLKYMSSFLFLEYPSV